MTERWSVYIFLLKKITYFNLDFAGLSRNFRPNFLPQSFNRILQGTEHKADKQKHSLSCLHTAFFKDTNLKLNCETKIQVSDISRPRCDQVKCNSATSVKQPFLSYLCPAASSRQPSPNEMAPLFSNPGTAAINHWANPHQDSNNAFQLHLWRVGMPAQTGAFKSPVMGATSMRNINGSAWRGTGQQED